MTENAIFKSFCFLHADIKHHVQELNMDKENIVSLSVLLFYIHYHISRNEGISVNRDKSITDCIKDICSISQANPSDIQSAINYLENKNSSIYLQEISKWGLFLENYDSLFRIIFEKYLTKTETASYYTDDSTTTYIVEGTISAFLYAIIYGCSKCEQQRVLSISDLEATLNNLDSKKKESLIKRVKKLKIIDPTCGTGSFIVKTISVLRHIYKLLSIDFSEKELKKVINNNIYGVDIDEEALEILRYRLFAISSYDFSGTLNQSNFKNFKLGNSICDDTFVWKNEFESVFRQGGFDCVVGNPPYMEYSVKKLNYTIPEYFRTQQIGNLYACVIERATSDIVSSKGTIGFIIPISIVATQRMKVLRELLQEKFTELFFVNFADRPCSLFHGVHQKLTVLIGTRNSNNTQTYVSVFKHWYKDEWNNLYKNIDFIKLDRNYSVGYPKLLSLLSKDIINKVIYNEQKSLLDNIAGNGKFAVWLNQRATFWCKCFTFPQKSNEYKKYSFNAEEDAYLFSAIMNSSLFFYLWEIYSDCWHITKKELNLIHLDFNLIEEKTKKEIVETYKQLEKELETSKVFIGSVQTDYIYQHKLHKSTIDKIDFLIGNIFGLNIEEINEIVNYQLKYRLNTEI